MMCTTTLTFLQRRRLLRVMSVAVLKMALAILPRSHAPAHQATPERDASSSRLMYLK